MFFTRKWSVSAVKCNKQCNTKRQGGLERTNVVVVLLSRCWAPEFIKKPLYLTIVHSFLRFDRQ